MNTWKLGNLEASQSFPVQHSAFGELFVMCLVFGVLEMTADSVFFITDIYSDHIEVDTDRRLH